MLLGALASVLHMAFYYDKRDDQKGLTIDDVKAAYHGLDAPSKMLVSVEDGHPENLSKDDRETLVKWLKSTRVQEDYQSLDLGASSPAEIVSSNCAECHSAKAAKPDPKAQALKLDSWADVQKIALARKVEPTPINIVVLSAHTHAPSMSMMGLAALGLMWMTRLPRGLVGLTWALAGLGLFLDISSWFITRRYEEFAYVIVGAGGVFNAMFVLAVALTIADLWWPMRRNADRPA